MTALAALLVLLGGVAIGATSIGGVVVVPALSGLGGVATERAVAAASFGFAFAGIAAFLARQPPGPAAEGPTPAFGWTAVLGAGAGAALGAATLAWLPARAVALVVALLAIGSGLHALLGGRAARQRLPGPVALALLGLVVGAFSAWSGTGGPVVLLPLLALLGWPAAQAVEAAQRVQLPVAAAATLVNFVAGLTFARTSPFAGDATKTMHSIKQPFVIALYFFAGLEWVMGAAWVYLLIVPFLLLRWLGRKLGGVIGGRLAGWGTDLSPATYAPGGLSLAFTLSVGLLYRKVPGITDIYGPLVTTLVLLELSSLRALRRWLVDVADVAPEHGSTRITLERGASRR